MLKSGTLYIDKNTIFHKLDGVTKLLLFAIWTIITFMFLDLRIFLAMFTLGMIMLYISKIPFKLIKSVFLFMITFNIINILFILLITPQYGSELTGSYTNFINIGYSNITLETIWYVLTLSFKYVNLLPMTLIFIFTTHPSKFASSLNKIGIPYKIAYAVNLAFRYIPDIQSEFNHIVKAQEARGISFRKGEASFVDRIKNFINVSVPLIMTSLKKIEVVYNAMELRGFGKKSKRTWYSGTKLQKSDYVIIVSAILLLILNIYLKKNYSVGFWYPLG